MTEPSTAAHMPGYFRALAVDYDGTPARGKRPTRSLLHAYMESVERAAILEEVAS